jgi:hypothetical protein
MMMNSERIKFENHNGILYVDVRMNDEFSLSDLDVICDEIQKNFSSCTDVICKKSGSYSVSLDVQNVASEGIKEFRNFVYVVDEDTKRQSAEYAVSTYMRHYNASVASSKEEAYAMLRKAG